MPLSVKIYDRLDVFVSRIGYMFGWLMLPLIVITIFDVVTRRFFVMGSTYMQEMEWHLHVMVFAPALAFAYMRNRQVRIDIFRSHWKPRTQAWIELIGCIVFLIPYGIMLVRYGFSLSHMAWVQNEVSSSAMGLSNRWAVKAFLPAGGFLLLLSGIAVAIRTWLYLFGPDEIQARIAPLTGFGAKSGDPE